MEAVIVFKLISEINHKFDLKICGYYKLLLTSNLIKEYCFSFLAFLTNSRLLPDCPITSVHLIIIIQLFCDKNFLVGSFRRDQDEYLNIVGGFEDVFSQHLNSQAIDLRFSITKIRYFLKNFFLNTKQGCSR